jgi:hypothetical protein
VVAALGILVRFRALLGIGGVAAFVLYGVYTWILKAGLISPLSPEASFGVISEVVKYTFVFAVTSVVLSAMAYTLPQIVPSLSLQLSADVSASVITRTINAFFALGVIGVIFAATSYTLLKILPSSVFEPTPKVGYSLAIAEMFDPFRVGKLAQILDKIELYPGFPYYSRESDHPSAWPLRVDRDRQTLFQEYIDLLSKFDFASRAGNDIKIVGRRTRDGERSRSDIIANLRNWYYNRLGASPTALVDVVGKDAAAAFLRVEQLRSDLRDDFPNRFALLRIKNIGKVDTKDITIELDIYGALYDHAISADAEHTHGATYDRAARRIVIDKMLPGYLVEIRFWYNYLPVDQRVFPDKKDIILDVTQGIVVNNIAVSGGHAIGDRTLVEQLDAYQLMYVGSAKKEDFEQDMRVYQERKLAESRDWTEKREREHPTLKNVPPDTLAASSRPDDSVNAIWVSFSSASGRSYIAVHVFKHPSGPYILLSSKDKDREDFVRVRGKIEEAYNGKAEEGISDRGDDIVSTIQVQAGFTQKGVAAQVRDWFQTTFKNTSIQAVYY